MPLLKYDEWSCNMYLSLFYMWLVKHVTLSSWEPFGVTMFLVNFFFSCFIINSSFSQLECTCSIVFSVYSIRLPWNSYGSKYYCFNADLKVVGFLGIDGNCLSLLSVLSLLICYLLMKSQHSPSTSYSSITPLVIISLFMLDFGIMPLMLLYIHIGHLQHMYNICFICQGIL